jgi:hypothetical protein
LDRKEHCAAYSYDTATKECKIFMLPHGSKTPVQVTTPNPDWSCTEVKPAKEADLDEKAPQVVYDVEAPLNLPGDLPIGYTGSSPSMKMVATKVTMPWTGKDCAPTSTWFSFDEPMSVDPKEFAALEGVLPLVPAKTVASTSMTLGKACVCFTSSCDTCIDPIIPDHYYGVVFFMLCCAAACGAAVVRQCCPKESNKTYSIKQIILEDTGGVDQPPIMVTLPGGGSNVYSSQSQMQSQMGQGLLKKAADGNPWRASGP